MPVTETSPSISADKIGIDCTTASNSARAMRNSTSWRITAPLRALTQQLSGGGKAGNCGGSVSGGKAPTRRWLSPSIVSGEHTTALSQSETGASRRAPTKLQLLPVPTSFPELDFPEVHNPTVSVVVHTRGEWRWTYNCLRTLQVHPSRLPFEVIVLEDESSAERGERLKRFRNLLLVLVQTGTDFTSACNDGAAMASGKYLVFLDSATQPQPGWIDALIDTFERYPDAGLVSSQLVYPDGRLQEAGGILLSGGRAWSYGRFDDPDKPEYRYVRRVDTCAHTSIALPRALFDGLGGFQARHASTCPTAEDLARRVCGKGRALYYQPASRVVHFEDSPSHTGIEEGLGRKDLQSVNDGGHFTSRRKGCGADVPSNGELWLARDQAAAGRVLVCDKHVPKPDRDSGSMRMRNLLRVFQHLGFKVTFAPLNFASAPPYDEELQQSGIEVLADPFAPDLDCYMGEHGSEFDVVVLSRVDTAGTLLESARTHCKSALIIFDTVDLHYLREMREAKLHDDEALLMRAEARRDQEWALMRSADLTFVVSEVERALLREQLPDVNVEVVSNIIDVRGRTAPFDNRRGIVFIGGFRHAPNVDAVLYFVEQIFPAILEEIPDLQFTVVGDKPPPQIKVLESPQIRITGYVEDITPWLDACRITVAPLRYGAGVKGKINSSLGLGVPVVATSLAAEGMFLKHGMSVLLGDDAPGFAQAVVDLYRNQDLWERISDAGMDVMRRRFGFETAREAVAGCLSRGAP